MPFYEEGIQNKRNDEVCIGGKRERETVKTQRNGRDSEVELVTGWTCVESGLPAKGNNYSGPNCISSFLYLKWIRGRRKLLRIYQP